MITSFVVPQTSKMNINDLIDRGGLLYAPNDDKPYTGKVFDFYDNDQKKLDGGYRKGLKNGKWNWWNTNGSFDSTGNYRKGLFDGHWEFYYDNGQLKAKGDYRDGDGTNRDEYGITTNGRNGKWTFWHKNGLQSSEGSYKDGNIVGIWTSWNEKGDKVWEGTLEEYKAAKEKAAAEKEAAELAAAEKAVAEKASKEAAAELAAAKNALAKLTAELAAAEKAAVEKAAAELAAKNALVKLTAELAAAEKTAAEMAAVAKAAEEMAATEKAASEMADAEKAAAEKATKEADAELAATKIALAELAAEKAAAEKAAAEKAAAEKAAQQVVDCQKKYDDSQEKYKAGQYEETVTILEDILQMDGCEGGISSKAQFYIGWNYGNKQYKLEEAKIAYQKVVDIYFSDLKYVERAKEKLTAYNLSDEANSVYNTGDFQMAVSLREKVVQQKGCDKTLAAKNQYLAGYIYMNKLNDFDRAKVAYQKVINNYTDSAYVLKAKKKLADLQ